MSKEEPINKSAIVYNQNNPLLAYDGIEVASHGDKADPTFDLLFTQEVGGTTSIAAAMRFSSAEKLEGFLKKVCDEVNEFRGDSLFDYQVRRHNAGNEGAGYFGEY